MPDSAHFQVQRELFLRSFFDVPPPSELAELLAARMRDRHFEPGDIIYRRGQPSGPMLFTTRGTVELEAPGEEPWVFTDRALIGAIDANTGQPYRRTARAVTRVHAIEMHFEEYLMLLEDFFDFAREMLMQGARRTHATALGLAPDGIFRPPGPASGPWLARSPLDEVERLMILKSTSAFEHAPVQPLVTLAQHAVERRVGRGERIFGAGDANRGLFFIADGRVRVTHDDPRVDASVGPGDMILGILGIVDEPYAFSAHAERETLLLELGHEDLYDAMEEHFGLARAWWVYMGHENHRVRQTLAEREVVERDGQAAS